MNRDPYRFPDADEADLATANARHDARLQRAKEFMVRVPDDFEGGQSDDRKVWASIISQRRSRQLECEREDRI